MPKRANPKGSTPHREEAPWQEGLGKIHLEHMKLMGIGMSFKSSSTTVKVVGNNLITPDSTHSTDGASVNHVGLITLLITT